jgi:ADP-dependent NAD(P)H-hydrate dehydratase / NAD(P)H-hydrate epimerase
MYLVTAKEMQEMDRQTIESFGIPGMVLMENAARGAVEALLSRINGKTDGKNIKRIAVLAGRGNNGGDGFVMARYLMEKGFAVSVFLLASKEGVKGDAAANLKLFETLCGHSDTGSLTEIRSQEEFDNLKLKILHHDLFIDALLGTGLNAEVRGIMKSAIDLLNASAKPVFSVDIPSGLSADTGLALGSAVKAFATATFAFAKIGHILHPGNSLTGELEIIDIGIPKYIADAGGVSLSLIEKDDIGALFPPRAFDTHKGHLGHLLVIAGSSGKTGAAALCANAAMRSGTGLVTVGVPESLNSVMEGLVLEAMTYPLPEEEKGALTQSCFKDIQELLKEKQALALGPGLGTHPGTSRLVEDIVSNCEIPLIIDADGLNHIATNPDILKQKNSSVILTPHPGEMARLCGLSTKEIQADRIGTAKQFAAQFKVILILKGAGTIIALPDGSTYICPTGNAGMASGGMGDVLTGMIAGFCAQGFSPEKASLAGVYLHGLCADILAEKIGGFGFLASDLIRTIPQSINQLAICR